MQFPYQPMDFAMDIHADMPTGCIIKYITRYPFKGGVEDLEKAKQNIDFIVGKIEKENYQVMLSINWHEKTCEYCDVDNLSENQTDTLFYLFGGYYNEAKKCIDKLIKEYKEKGGE